MKNFILSLGICFLSPVMGFAQSELLKICQDKNIDQSLLIIDNGFCEQYLKSEIELGLKESLQPYDCLKQKTDKWKVRFYASHSFTSYFDTDVTFKSSRYNIEIKDYSWAERSSREFFKPSVWKEDGHNPLQLIDEPTNTFVVSIEKNGHEFFLSAFHPKFLQQPDQVKQITGTIDGVEVNGVQPVNKPFDGWDQTPGESEIVRNQNTHQQMTFELGYGYRFKILDTKIGSLSYVPSIGLGVMVGNNYSAVVAQDQWYEFEDNSDGYKLQGIGGSITNRIEINSAKEYIGLFYENKLAFYKQEHGFLDGTQKYNLGFMGNSFGIKFMIFNPKNREAKKLL